MLQKEIDFIKKNKLIYKSLKKIIECPFVWGIVLFGSYSKGTETKKSDVDLICITNNKKEVTDLVKSLKYESGVNFSLVALPLEEFPMIKKDNPELWYDLKMYGICFKGDDNFYYWMYKDEEN